MGSERRPGRPQGILRERDAARAAIDRALRAALRGSGRAVFVAGEAGVGKTALLTWGRAAAADRLRVVQAAGSAMEASLPFAFAEQFVDPLRADRAVDETDDGPDPLTLRASVRDLARVQVRQWARSGPVVVLLDDLHWADPDSLDLLGFLARRLDRLPVALLAGLRPWPPRAGALAESLARGGAADLVRLDPLSADAAGALLADLAGPTVSDELRERAYTLTGGNPLLLVEAARSLRAEGDLPQPGGSGLDGLRRVLLLSHLAAVPAAVVHCVRAAAVLGTQVRLADVQAVAGQEAVQFADCLDSAVGAGILQPDRSGWVRFSHDLLAAAVYDDTAPAHRQLLHARAFEHYLQRGDTGLAAPHAVAADLAGDQRAVTTVARAGSQALREGAVETGLAQLAAAVELSGSEPSAQLLGAQADALFAVGRSGEAIDIYRRLLADPRDAATGTTLRVRLARARVHAGALDRARADYDQLLARPDELGPDLLAVQLERAHVVWEQEGPRGALAALAAVRVPAAAADAVAAVTGYFRMLTGDPSGLPALERAVAATRGGPPPSQAQAVATLNVLALHASTLGMTERVEQALDLADEGEHRLRAAGALRSTVSLRLVRMALLIKRGSLFAALAEADDLEEELDLEPLARPHLAVYRAQALIGLGRLDEARALCDATETSRQPQPWFVQLSLAAAKGRLLLADGRADAAVDTFRRAEQLASRLGLGEPCAPRWASGAIDAALAAGRADDAERIVAWLAETGARLPCQWPRMIALAGRAGCAALAGDDERADAGYQQALATPCVVPLDRARIQWRYGSWLRRRNRPVRARAPLAEAVRTAEEHGAARLAADARAELLAAGGRRRRQHATGLTAQESRIARIALTGATNGEIAAELQLSPRTVESHLSSVYRKLAISSKRELRQRRGELDLTPLGG